MSKNVKQLIIMLLILSALLFVSSLGYIENLEVMTHQNYIKQLNKDTKKTKNIKDKDEDKDEDKDKDNASKSDIKLKELINNLSKNKKFGQGMSSNILPGTEDMYILKSKIVPPVCPKCPESGTCPRQKPCPPCQPCARCPEPAFECKKVPNYNVSNVNNELPMPMLNSFADFA